MNKELADAIYEVIIKILPTDLTVIYICLSGSRGKELDSDKSDYDVKVIIINKKCDYILQRIKSHIKIKTTLNGLTLEGQAHDITNIFTFALSTNLLIWDLLTAPVVYNKLPEVMNGLRDIFYGLYNHKIMLKSLQGMCHANYSKSQKVVKIEGHISVKYIVEMIYNVLLIRSLFLNKGEGEDNQCRIYTINDVMKYIKKDEEELVKELIKIRKSDKDMSVVYDEKLKKFVKDGLDEIEKLYKNFDSNGSFEIEEKESTKKILKMRELADEIILNLLK